MTAYSWVLIIAMYSPGGDFMSQDIVKLDSRRTCEAIRIQLPKLDNPMYVQHKGVCVTRDHWEGKKKMPGVAYD
jgi:hypothetical protein